MAVTYVGKSAPNALSALAEPAPVDALLPRLATTAKRLNDATEEANEYIKHLETFLTEGCKIGVTTGVKMCEQKDGSSDWLFYLRINSKFRVVVSKFRGDQCLESKTWSECDRNMKFVALAHVPELLTKLEEMAAQDAARAEEAVAAAKSLLVGLL